MIQKTSITLIVLLVLCLQPEGNGKRKIMKEAKSVKREAVIQSIY